MITRRAPEARATCPIVIPIGPVPKTQTFSIGAIGMRWTAWTPQAYTSSIDATSSETCSGSGKTFSAVARSSSEKPALPRRSPSRIPRVGQTW